MTTTAAASPGAPVNLSALLTEQSRKLRNSITRLPFLTRVILYALPVVHLLCYILPIAGKLNLDPKAMDLNQMHRLNTYPLIHTSLLHLLFNTLALAPLLSRFEREVGSLKTLLLIAGPLVTFPAGLYLGIEMFILNRTTAVQGASALVFTLLAYEAMRTYAHKPAYVIAGVSVPSWATPFGWCLLASLVPGGSLLGHLCALAVGYAFAGRWLRLLEPSEWVLGKVEGLVGWLVRWLPGWVGLEERAEGEWLEMLPAVGGKRFTGTGEEGRVLGKE